MSAGTESPGQEDVQVIQAAYQLTIERSDPQRTAHSIERFLLREIPFTNRWTLQAGRAVKVASFADRRQALEKG